MAHQATVVRPATLATEISDIVICGMATWCQGVMVTGDMVTC